VGKGYSARRKGRNRCEEQYTLENLAHGKADVSDSCGLYKRIKIVGQKHKARNEEREKKEGREWGGKGFTMRRCVSKALIPICVGIWSRTT
jgi:hypothetical protein